LACSNASGFFGQEEDRKGINAGFRGEENRETLIEMCIRI